MLAQAMSGKSSGSTSDIGAFDVGLLIPSGTGLFKCASLSASHGTVAFDAASLICEWELSTLTKCEVQSLIGKFRTTFFRRLSISAFPISTFLKSFSFVAHFDRPQLPTNLVFDFSTTETQEERLAFQNEETEHGTSAVGFSRGLFKGFIKVNFGLNFRIFGEMKTLRCVKYWHSKYADYKHVVSSPIAKHIFNITRS